MTSSPQEGVRRSAAYLWLIVVAVLGAIAALGTSGFGATADTSAPPSKPFDLVYISDSSGWGVAGVYGRQIRKALGVAVRVHDEWRGNLSAVEILNELRYGVAWPRLIRDAEVIVLYGSPAGLQIVRGGDCISSTDPPLEVGPQLWTKYVPALKAIYKRIFQIRKGKPVILRAPNMYNPVISQAPEGQQSWEEAGIADICTKLWESYAAAIAKAAAAYRVPVADVYTAFNGKDHREDPVAKGYLQPDGIHPSTKGRAVIAQTLADLGYKQVKPPR
jgi:hypothetical protein